MADHTHPADENLVSTLDDIASNLQRAVGWLKALTVAQVIVVLIGAVLIVENF